MLTCQQCGWGKNPEEAAFCTNCGNPLARSRPLGGGAGGARSPSKTPLKLDPMAAQATMLDFRMPEEIFAALGRMPTAQVEPDGPAPAAPKPPAQQVAPPQSPAQQVAPPQPPAQGELPPPPPAQEEAPPGEGGWPRKRRTTDELATFTFTPEGLAPPPMPEGLAAPADLEAPPLPEELAASADLEAPWPSFAPVEPTGIYPALGAAPAAPSAEPIDLARYEAMAAPPSQPPAGSDPLFGAPDIDADDPFATQPGLALSELAQRIREEGRSSQPPHSAPSEAPQDPPSPIELPIVAPAPSAWGGQAAGRELPIVAPAAVKTEGGSAQVEGGSAQTEGGSAQTEGGEAPAASSRPTPVVEMPIVSLPQPPRPAEPAPPPAAPPEEIEAQEPQAAEAPALEVDGDADKILPVRARHEALLAKLSPFGRSGAGAEPAEEPSPSAAMELPVVGASIATLPEAESWVTQPVPLSAVQSAVQTATQAEAPSDAQPRAGEEAAGAEEAQPSGDADAAEPGEALRAQEEARPSEDAPRSHAEDAPRADAEARTGARPPEEGAEARADTEEARAGERAEAEEARAGERAEAEEAQAGEAQREGGEAAAALLGKPAAPQSEASGLGLLKPPAQPFAAASASVETLEEDLLDASFDDILELREPEEGPDAAEEEPFGELLEAVSLTTIPPVSPAAPPAAAEAPKSPAKERVRPPQPPPIPAAERPAFVLQPIGLSAEPLKVGAEAVILGRAQGLCAQDPYTSLLHARLELRAEGLELTDLESENGVWLRLREPHRLRVGEEFLVGTQRLRLAQEPPPKPQEPTEVLRFGAQVEPTGLRLHVLDDRGEVIHDLRLGGEGCRIGRQLGELVFPEDELMSMTHAYIQAEGEDAILDDLQSHNGTWLRIPQKARLFANDTIRVGQTLLRVAQTAG